MKQFARQVFSMSRDMHSHDELPYRSPQWHIDFAAPDAAAPDSAA